MKVIEIINATGGILLSGDVNSDITGFCQDTRKIQVDDMYIPIVGENFDGHSFIEKAFELGASAVITQVEIKKSDKIVILVEDTLIALQNMAKYIRSHRDIKVIAVTGSVGKTSTKDMIESVVSMDFSVIKTLGNYNNAIGLPLTILRHSNEEVMILEMGMSSLGEIEVLSEIATPDIAVITNIGTAHIGELGSQDNIFKAKMEIISHLTENGCLIVNGDDPYLKSICSDDFSVYKVSTNINDETLLDKFELLEESSNCIIDGLKVEIPVPGIHFILNALVALKVSSILGQDMKKSLQGIEKFSLTTGRNDIIKFSNDITCIDSTYNASEDSIVATLGVLSNYKNRKIAILGDILELGSFSSHIHEKIGETVFKSNVDVLYCVGNHTKITAKKAKDLGVERVYHFVSNDELIPHLFNNIIKGDTIMLKGSNGMNLSMIVDKLKEKYND